MELDFAHNKLVYTLIATILLISFTCLWLINKLQSNNNDLTNLQTSAVQGKTATAKPTFAIVGPMYSGKTSLFNLLTTDSIRPCVTSQELSIWPKFRGGATTLIEFPGHVKLQYKWQNWLKSITSSKDSNSGRNLKGIIFVVDSTLDPKHWDEPAELLVDILEQLETLSQPTDLLIACNKSDSFTARPPQRIKTLLEQTIASVLTRRKASLARDNGNTSKDNDEDASFNPLLDMFADPTQFRFDVLETSVEALAGSVLKRDVDSWQQWLEDH